MASIDFVRDKYVALGKERLAPPVVLEENPVVEGEVVMEPKFYSKSVILDETSLPEGHQALVENVEPAGGWPK